MDTFEINKIKQKLSDLKEYLISLLIFETNEIIEDRFEKYDEVIKAKKKLFTLIKEYLPDKYNEFEKITTIQYNKFSKKNLEEIKSKFFDFYNYFLLHLKIEKVNQFNNEEEKKNETDYKKMKYNVLKDDEENNWDNSYENLNLNLYETKSDTTNKYNTTLNFDYSSLNSFENDF